MLPLSLSKNLRLPLSLCHKKICALPLSRDRERKTLAGRNHLENGYDQI